MAEEQAEDPQPIPADSPQRIEYAGSLLAPNKVATLPRRDALTVPQIRWGIVLGAAFLGTLAVLSVFVGALPGTIVAASLLAVAVFKSTLLRFGGRFSDTAVLAYLHQAARMNLPLPPMLHHAAESERGKISQQLEKLAVRLETGWPVAEALASATPGLSDRTLSLVAASENTGSLVPGLDRLIRQRRQTDRVDSSADVTFLRWYPALLVVLCIVLVKALTIFVFPKYFMILRDFGIPMPHSLTVIAVVADWIAPLLAVLLALVAAALVTRWILNRFVPRTLRAGPLQRVVDPFFWHLPLFRSISQPAALADACNVLADSLDAGQPFDRGLWEASQLRINSVLQMRLHRWATLTAAGASLTDGARKAAMPGLMIGLLSTGQATADLAQVLRFLARYYEQRYSRAAILLRSAMIPLMAITFGLVVFYLMRGVFEPLIVLMDKLTPMGHSLS